ncbi:hypothetical protein [Lentibacillus juripiscarius]|uniref:hypothetical protein n=1 Tax=Lentibacillus juripiscarius TaxID=257446 RepID=UPI0036D33947
MEQYLVNSTQDQLVCYFCFGMLSGGYDAVKVHTLEEDHCRITVERKIMLY